MLGLGLLLEGEGEVEGEVELKVGGREMAVPPGFLSLSRGRGWVRVCSGKIGEGVEDGGEELDLLL